MKMALHNAEEMAVSANFHAVPGLNCAHQNLSYIKVLTVQLERQEVVGKLTIFG